MSPLPGQTPAAPLPRRPRPGHTRPSMADVAAAAGVSHQTVSRVLNGSPTVRDQTRERVEQAIADLGYRRNLAARALASNRSNRLGVVAAHLSLYGPRTITAAVQAAAHRAGFEVALVGLDEFSAQTLTEAIDRLLDQDVEAVVAAVAHTGARELTAGLGVAVPVVQVEGVTPGQAMAAGVDQERGAFLATEHLLGLGHRQVALVGGPPEWIEAAQRRAGWLAAHAARGAAPGPELSGDWSPAAGYRAGVALLDDPGTTAVLAANDAMAQGVLRAVHERGLAVPGQVSVVGFDDVPEAEFTWPPLTTVRQDFTTLGEHAVELAVRALRGEDEPTLPLVEPELVVRATSGPVPKA